MGKRQGILLLMYITLVPGYLGAEDDLIPLLQAQTVTLNVSRDGRGAPEAGSGVILCQEEDQVYILSAKHVLYGKTLGNTRGPDLSTLNRLVISFFKNLVPPIDEGKEESKIAKQWAGRNQDLVLLRVPLEPVLTVTATLGTATTNLNVVGRELAVYAIGSEQKPGQNVVTWVPTKGALFRYDDEFIYHSAPITSGFSGGPLFNESGALIGINIETIPGEVIGGDPATEYGKAWRIESVISTVNKWLPGTCLRTTVPFREIAFGTYRRAMRAVSVKDWREAERLMGQAVHELPWEGGTVHLQGMRYTTYLPRYHLGLALYKQNRCREALREWGRSEVQRAVLEDKRYRKLKKFQKKCTDLLNREIKERPEKPGEGK